MRQPLDDAVTNLSREFDPMMVRKRLAKCVSYLRLHALGHFLGPKIINLHFGRVAKGFCQFLELYSCPIPLAVGDYTRSHSRHE
jgi:hypothetical protein